MNEANIRALYIDKQLVTAKLNRKSWLLNAADICSEIWDLTVSNPNRAEQVDNRTPQEIIAEIEELDAEAVRALKTIRELL